MTDPLQDRRREIIESGVRAGEAKLPRRPQPRPPYWRRPWSWVLAAAVAVLIVCLAALAVVALHARSDAQTARGDASSARVAAIANAGGLAQANSRIRSLGGTPVPTPTNSFPTGPAGPSGATGASGPGPSLGAIQAAVAAYCDRHSDCTGTPSQAQVVRAVKAFCAAGACTGPQGPSGSSGSPGASGSSGPVGASGSPGADGESPTATDISSAVAAYCAAHGDCTGPAGPQGEQGKPGTNGRGISSLTCTGLGLITITVTYDDGTTVDVPCNGGDPTTEPAPATETP